VVLFILSSLPNVVGYQTVQFFNQKTINNEITEKDSFVRTIIDSNNSYINNKLKHHSDYYTHYLLIWRIRGDIKNLETGRDHYYHFNTTHVVSMSFALVFVIPFLPLPLFTIDVSRNEEWWLVWGENHLFNKEIITENYIDFFCIDWGELSYPDQQAVR
jgi:hypothetical protein